MSLKKKIYSQESFQHHFLHQDIKLWREELEGIMEEIIFFKNFLQEPQHNPNLVVNSKKLVEKLREKQFENAVYQSRLHNFTSKLQGINECDDIQCETFYFNGYVDFKLQIESFLFKYRKLKRSIFLKINNHLKKENVTC